MSPSISSLQQSISIHKRYLPDLFMDRTHATPLRTFLLNLSWP